MGDCLSVEPQFNRWLPTFHLSLCGLKLWSLKLQLAANFVETCVERGGWVGGSELKDAAPRIQGSLKPDA